MDRFNANSADCAFTIREFITICGFASRLSSTFYFFRFLFLFSPPLFNVRGGCFNLRIQILGQMFIVNFQRVIEHTCFSLSLSLLHSSNSFRFDGGTIDFDRTSFKFVYFAMFLYK